MLNVKDFNMTHDKDQLLNLYSTALSIKLVWVNKTKDILRASKLKPKDIETIVRSWVTFISEHDKALRKELWKIHESEER